MSSRSFSQVDSARWSQPYQGVGLSLSFVQWLALAALADWLIARTLTRLAIFMPKSPLVVMVYQVLGLVGQVATSLSGLLGLGVLGWMAWREWRAGSIWLPPLLLGLGAASLVFLVIPPSGWLAIGNYALGLAAAGIILARVSSMPGNQTRGNPWTPGVWAVLVPGMAFVAGRLYQAVAAWYTAMRWPGPPFAAGVLFNLGELLVVLSAAAWWWAYGRGASWRMGLGATLPAFVFAAMRLAIPSMTGVLAMWSTGLTLYLPWPLYVASLWLAGVAVLASLRRGDLAGWAILLLVAGGYAPQLSLQVFLNLIGLWLLASRQPMGLTQKGPPACGEPL